MDSSDSVLVSYSSLASAYSSSCCASYTVRICPVICTLSVLPVSRYAVIQFRTVSRLIPNSVEMAL